MPFADRARSLLARPRLLIAVAIALQWVTTAVVALRAEDIAWGTVELANVLLLGPLALVCACRVAERIGGVALGAWTLLVWVALPWLASALTVASYDATLRNDVLPLMVGLSAGTGWLEGVAILSATALLAAQTRAATAAGALLFAALLVVWLSRLPVGDLSLDAFQVNMAGLREYFWSQRLLQWLPLAGVIGVARRSVPLALLLGGWLGGYLAFGAARSDVGYADGEFFRVLLPALPAYLLLTAAIPLLVPTLAVRLGPLAKPS